VRGECVNTIVNINLNNGEDIQISTQGNDMLPSFLSQTVLYFPGFVRSSKYVGKDGTNCGCQKLADGSLGEKTDLAGEVDESIFRDGRPMEFCICF